MLTLISIKLVITTNKWTWVNSQLAAYQWVSYVAIRSCHRPAWYVWHCSVSAVRHCQTGPRNLSAASCDLTHTNTTTTIKVIHVWYMIVQPLFSFFCYTGLSTNLLYIRGNCLANFDVIWQVEPLLALVVCWRKLAHYSTRPLRCLTTGKNLQMGTMYFVLHSKR